MRSLVLYCALAGCSFQPSDANPGDGRTDGSIDGARDAGPDGPFVLGDVAHVPSSVEVAFEATGALTIATGTLDTGTPGGAAPAWVGVTPPAGVVLMTSAQDAGMPELAIVELAALTVSGTFTVRGGRPLVIIAARTIEIEAGGVIDASANHGVPGPSGGAMGVGSGAGAAGNHTGTSNDSGGGGGGYGQMGGAGQTDGSAIGGTGGGTYNTALAALIGGSGGGTQSPSCGTALPAGAGGGAVQLYAQESIRIDGALLANGGGGNGGANCNGTGGGAGGGSGGAIHLQSPTVSGAGMALAQGGGGGGGATTSGGTINGGIGENGPTTIAAAAGGTSAASGNGGGTGGFRDAPPGVLSGTATGIYNGGGGGGGAGVIVIHSAHVSALPTSPTAAVIGS